MFSGVRDEISKMNTHSRKGLMLTCDPMDAEVLVEGVPMGTCLQYAEGLPLRKGAQKVTLRKEGYLPFETWVALDGTRSTLSVTLAPSNLGGAP